VLQYR
jgi:hypothetical protein